jgi:predicted metal-dependent hydrolase
MADRHASDGSASRILRVGNLDINVRVSERRRTVGLTVERDATITLAVPPGTGDDALLRLINQRQQWLYARLRERAELGQPRPREYVSGEGFPYLGRLYRLLLVDEADVPVRLNLTSRRLELRRDSVNDAARHLTRWYRQQGTEWLGPRAAPWAQRMAVEMTALRVRSLGYRWGSCSPSGAVNIHWAAMQLSPDLIDYVLVHELAHRRHPDHRAGFWATIERCMPDYAARRDRLRHAGPDLWLPGPAPKGMDDAR